MLLAKEETSMRRYVLLALFASLAVATAQEPPFSKQYLPVKQYSQQ